MDVLNDIVVDARITKYRTSERKIAKQHIESLDSEDSILEYKVNGELKKVLMMILYFFKKYKIFEEMEEGLHK